MAPDKPLDPDALLIKVPENEDEVVAVRKGTVFGTFDNKLACEALALKEYGLHTHTVRDELKTLTNRHLQATPTPRLTSRPWRTARRILDALAADIGVCRKTPIKQILKGKTSRAKSRFLGGVELIKRTGYKKAYSRLTCMQKLELHDVSKLVEKEDRAIQFRTTAYNSVLTRYLWQIEHRAFNQTKHNGFRWSAKGLTKSRRATLLLKMASTYDDPIYVCADHSRFDAHVNKHLLKLEHRLYKRCYGYNQELCDLLSGQMNNRGTTRGGIEYSCLGKRMSGDCNTALGNSVLNYAMLAAWLEDSGVVGNILLDGDDSIIVIDRCDLGALPDIATYMLNFGMVTEAEVVDDVRQAEFCQSRVVMGPLGPYFCPNPRKLLDTIRRSPQNLAGCEKEAVLKASIACELVANPNMPMMRAYAEWCQSSGVKLKVPDSLRYRVYSGYGTNDEALMAAASSGWGEPTEDERYSFYVAWGITPTEQRDFEREVRFCPFYFGLGAKFRVKEGVRCDDVMPDETFWLEDPDNKDDQDLTELDWMNAPDAFTSYWANALVR